MTTPAELRQQASMKNQEAIDSFERCDTDGALSQWASGLTARRLLLEADILERGGVSKFITLFTVEGEFQPAVVIEGKYGKSWMILDAEGKRTGQYVTFMPKRRETLAKKGFVEGYAMFPAKADYHEGSGGLVGVTVKSKKTVPHHFPPQSIVTTDRWAEEEEK